MRYDRKRLVYIAHNCLHKLMRLAGYSVGGVASANALSSLAGNSSTIICARTHSLVNLCWNTDLFPTCMPWIEQCAGRPVIGLQSLVKTSGVISLNPWGIHSPSFPFPFLPFFPPFFFLSPFRFPSFPLSCLALFLEVGSL